jgi:hypothetical protein
MAVTHNEIADVLRTYQGRVNPKVDLRSSTPKFLIVHAITCLATPTLRFAGNQVRFSASKPATCWKQ